MRGLIRVALFPLAQSLISLGNMDVPGSALGSARVPRAMPARSDFPRPAEKGLSRPSTRKRVVDGAAEGKARHGETPSVRAGPTVFPGGADAIRISDTLHRVQIGPR